MAITLYDSDAKPEKKRNKAASGVATGIVINNCDLISQGKVLVRIPSLDQEVWARLSSPGAGSGAGFFYVPRADDEVLVALNDNEPPDAFIVGGLWSTHDSPPVSNPVESMLKRVIKTGLEAGLGHEVEFDDGPGQSITITTTTRQKITLDPFKIELTNDAGTLTISMDNTTQTITIRGPIIQIGDDQTGKVQIKGKVIQVGSMQNVSTTIQGKMVLIN